MKKLFKKFWAQDVQVRTVFCAIFVCLLAPFYFTPLEGEFRLSAGVIAMGTLLLACDELAPFDFCALSGILTIGMRILLSLLVGVSFSTALADHLTTLVFYLIYGALTSQLLRDRSSKRNLFFALATADICANLTESLIRLELTPHIMTVIISAALLRSLVSVGCASMLSIYRVYLVENERRLRYDRLCLLLSQVRVENFYLQKTTAEIDRIMRLSFSLYDANRSNPEVGEQALEISRSIHEVGKDTRRVRQGLDAMISSVEQQKMSLQEIMSILRGNTAHLLGTDSSQLTVTFDVASDLHVGQCYGLLAVLNNLLTNALDACNGEGQIAVRAEVEGENAVFTIRDSGSNSGIDPELLPFIFNPGFTTKFDPETGHSSTGIGLNHVQNVVHHLGGTIAVDSEYGCFTLFTVTMPIQALSKQTYRL